MLIAVGALFPVVGDTIGKLDLPQGVSDLLGGADYGTITGWFRSEIGSVYGSLVIAALSQAPQPSRRGEDRILALVLAHPIRRSRLVLAKAAAIAVVVLVVAFATWVGMMVGVAVAGGGISFGHITAFTLHLACFGFATGAVALALGAATGRRSLATGAAAGIAIAGLLINGFAPLVDAISWLKYLSLFYYYEGRDPLTRGVDIRGVVMLGAVTVLLTSLAMVGIERRDLRA